jgi:hypothetical protein
MFRLSKHQSAKAAASVTLALVLILTMAFGLSSCAKKTPPAEPEPVVETDPLEGFKLYDIYESDGVQFRAEAGNEQRTDDGELIVQTVGTTPTGGHKLSPKEQAVFVGTVAVAAEEGQDANANKTVSTSEEI